ncbi:unnamed protein product, partial [Parnassius apollo]
MSRKECVFKCDKFGLNAETSGPCIPDVLPSSIPDTSSRDNRIKGTLIKRK